MFLSDEPGFYKPNDFGIRIENDMEVVLANKSTYDNKQYLRFNTITLVPYERSLIDETLLTDEHIAAIDTYHQKVSEILEPLLKNDESALKALRSRTVAIKPVPPVESKTLMMRSSLLVITLMFVLTVFF